MTDEKIQALKDDIAFMKALAQEGSTAPLLFGRNLVAAGAIFGAGSVVHWAMQTGVLRIPSPWFFMINWAVAGAIYGLVLTLQIRRGRGQPGANAAANKATAAAWSGIGFAIFASWLGMTAIGLTTGMWQVMAVFPVLILSLYGAAWFVAASLSGKGWIRLVAIGSFVGAVAMGAMTGSPFLMLGYAACLILLTILPGLILMRQEPSDTI